MTRKALPRALIPVIASLAPSSGLWAQCGYTVEKAPPIDCGSYTRYADPREINEVSVVGNYGDCDLDGTQGFIWSGGGLIVTISPPPGADGIFVTDRSAGGKICGSVWVPTSPSNGEGYVLDNGSYTLLGTMPRGNYSQATALNDEIVVGKWGHSASIGPKAFIWSKGVMTTLDLPMGPNHEAEAVNQRGQIVGWMGSSVVSGNHAFIYENGVVTDLGSLPDGTTASPTSINNSTQIVGYGKVYDPELMGTVTRPFVCSDGEFIVLGTLPGYSISGASDINDYATVVGSCSQVFEWPRAFVWRDGVMTALNDLVPLDSNINIKSASAINNAGQIAGEAQDADDEAGENPYAVLLTPIPAVPGDTNCNKIVDVDDLLTVINGWGTCKKFSPCPGDLLENDIVDVDDLLLVINNWTPPR